MKLHRDVYEPAEDTDLLIRVLREREPDLRGARALDVGTGTGAVARALAALGADVVATDISPLAVTLARENLGEARVVRADLASALRGRFDVVAFNAPYLPSAPDERVEGWLDQAFHGGEGGIEVTERLVRDLPRVLSSEGRAYVVVSSRADLERLARIVETHGLAFESVGSARFFFEEIAVWKLWRS